MKPSKPARWMISQNDFRGFFKSRTFLMKSKATDFVRLIEIISKSEMQFPDRPKNH